MHALLHCALALALAGEPDRFVAVPFVAIPFEVAPSTVVDSRIYPESPALSDGYVVLDGPGEAFLDYAVLDNWDKLSRQPRQLVVHSPNNGEIRGRVFLPAFDFKSFRAHTFTLPPGESSPGARSAFYEVMERHYQRLLNSQAVGAPWFRGRIAEARAAHGLGPESPAQQRMLTRRRAEFDDTFDLFTGERALAENLDLDRGLFDLKDEAPTIDVARIPGVSTRALDWKPLVKDLKPELDPLAGFIPSDQYAAFFPSFAVMVRVIDEIDSTASPILAVTSASTQDQRTKERYQAQLCLPFSTLARLFGPAVISSIAITGSDPFLPSGSDLAVLFESPQPAALESLISMHHAEAKAGGATPLAGSIFGVKYAGVSTVDRRVSSIVARIGDTIVVTNSLVQLRRILSARADQVPRLETADEYVWFRERYRRGDDKDSAFLVLTDAAIRSWVGPRVRIGESRRVRAAAAMGDLQARQLDALAQGKLAVGTSAADISMPLSSDFVWTASGVNSPTWGNLGFLTPIAELEIARVTESETRAYEAFRRGFESRWRNFFDPIALRLSVSDQGIGADMTVMPLVAGSDYSEMIDLARHVSLAPAAGDPHANTLIHFVTAFSKDSSAYQWLNRRLWGTLNYFGPDSLAWMGDCVAVYADRDLIWDEIKARRADRDIVYERIFELPIALEVDVDDPVLLDGFLTSLRRTLDEIARDWLQWQDKTWNERSYVEISLVRFTEGLPAALYYVALPDALIVSFREDVVQRAIDRDIARKAGKLEASAPPPWLGESVSMTADRDALIVLEQLWSGDREAGMRRAAWLALPILNEWKQRFPNEDPVRFHERMWGIRLVSPGGGAFVWNEALQTMETTDYGCPAAPRSGPPLSETFASFARGEFGLTFENEGLRARVKLLRE